MYLYKPASIHRLERALDEACETYGCRVHVTDLGMLAAAWRRGLEHEGRGAILNVGRLIAVGWRSATPGSVPVVFIGEWAYLARDDDLHRRAAAAVEALAVALVREHGEGVRPQYAAVGYGPGFGMGCDGGVALVQQAPRPSVELWDVGDASTLW